MTIPSKNVFCRFSIRPSYLLPALHSTSLPPHDSVPIANTLACHHHEASNVPSIPNTPTGSTSMGMLGFRMSGECLGPLIQNSPTPEFSPAEQQNASLPTFPMLEPRLFLRARHRCRRRCHLLILLLLSMLSLFLPSLEPCPQLHSTSVND